MIFDGVPWFAIKLIYYGDTAGLQSHPFAISYYHIRRRVGTKMGTISPGAFLSNLRIRNCRAMGSSLVIAATYPTRTIRQRNSTLPSGFTGQAGFHECMTFDERVGPAEMRERKVFYTTSG